MGSSLRHTLIGRFRQRLEQRGHPRLQMALLVAITAGAGFICSVALLHAGVAALWLRYLLSVGLAYLVFLGLLWLWMRTSAPSFIEPRDLVGLTTEERNAGNSWREPRTHRGSGLDDLFDIDFELGLPLLVLVFLGAVLLACCYIVYGAPLLFAELMLDGVLAATLYRRLRTLDARHWLATAVRRTCTTFLVAGAVVVISGLIMERLAPGAGSFGEVIMHILH